MVDNQVIGAIGVGGASSGDEHCGYEALTKVLGPNRRWPPRAHLAPWDDGASQPWLPLSLECATSAAI